MSAAIRSIFAVAAIGLAATAWIDRASAQATRMDEASDTADRAVAQRIRQGLLADGSLSFQARRIGIEVRNRVVTLRGTVKAADERSRIRSLARRAGSIRVVDQLRVERQPAVGP